MKLITSFAIALFCFVGDAENFAALPPLSQPATSFGAAVSNGWIYVYGGNTGKAHEFHRDCIKGDFFRLKLTGDSEWERLPGERALLGAAMAAHDGWIYRVGGMEARNEKGAKKDLHSIATVMRFNPESRAWQSLPDLPEARSSHDIAVLDDILYVGGGWKLTGGGDGEDSHGEWHKTILALDLRKPKTGWQALHQPFERRALAVVAHKNRLWFIGGMNSHDEPSLAVEWYEPRTRQWGKGPELPKGAMAGFGIAVCSAGGELIASPLSRRLYALKEEGGERWEEIAKLERPRFFHRLLPTERDQVVVVGGSDRKEQIRELESISLTEKSEEKPLRAEAIQAPAVEARMPSEPRNDAPWPQWRGHQRDGVSSEHNLRTSFPAKGSAELWRAQVGLGMSSCVVAGGRVITQGNSGEGVDSVLALDAANGAELWKYSFPCPTSAHEMPIVPNGPGSTPTIVGDRVFVLSREGDLLCLQTSNGHLIWRKNLVTDFGGKRPVYGYAQSPLVDDGRVFADIGKGENASGSTIALNASDGALIWQTGTGEAGYSSARTVEQEGHKLIAMLKGQALDLFDPRDGKVISSYRTMARDFTNAATPALVGHRILVSNTGTDLAALLDWDATADPRLRVVWQHKQFALLFNSAIVHEGSLFAFNEKRRGHDEFTCVSAETGESRWVSNAVPTSTFILAGDTWIFLTREGEVVLAPASSEGLSPTVRFKALEGKCYATPALANGRLYVRNNSGEIAAFDLRASP